MSTRNLIIAFSFVALMSAATVRAEKPTPAQETYGEYIANIQIRSAEPIISYCTSELPALRPDLESEFIVFKRKFHDAAAPMIQKLSGDPEFSAPVPPELREQFTNVDESMLAQVKQSDPGVYCPGMLANMRVATVEGLRTAIESAFSQYEEASKNKPQ